ncbi:hypothetical protein [Ferruginibacter profundus]
MKLFITILILFVPFLIYGQSFNFTKIKTVAIDSLRKIDHANKIKHTYTIDISEDYFPNRTKFALAQPIIYGKKVDNFKNEVSFFYTKADSLVRLIEYEWEGDENATDSAYYEIVKKNKETISTYFNTMPNEIPETETKAAKSIWENELVFVQQLIMPGLQRIRVLVSWK